MDEKGQIVEVFVDGVLLFRGELSPKETKAVLALVRSLYEEKDALNISLREERLWQRAWGVQT